MCRRANLTPGGYCEHREGWGSLGFCDGRVRALGAAGGRGRADDSRRDDAPAPSAVSPGLSGRELRDMTRRTSDDPPVPAVEVLGRQLETLGLTPSESRVLLGLLQAGSATAVQLARLSGVPRASTYQVIEELAKSGLIERMPGEGVALWGTPGPNEVLGRLEAIEEERHSQYQAQAKRLRAAMAKNLPAVPMGSLPGVRLLPNAAQVKRFGDRLFSGTKQELLVFSRPPYVNAPDRPLRAVLRLLRRGVPSRCVTRPAELADPDANTYRPDLAAYAEAGMQMRLVDDLDLKLLVADRRMASVSLVHGNPVDYPATLLADDAAMAALLADAFEQRWPTGTPWAP